MSQQLSDDLARQIENEALASTVRLKNNNDGQAGYIQGRQDGYHQGATTYALHCEQLAAALEACINYMNNGQTEFHSVLDNAEEALSNYNQLIKKV